MKNKLLIYLILLSFFLMFNPLVEGQTDLNGTLKRNHFIDEKWVNRLDDVIINTTSTKLQLNESTAVLEDFTSYTEVDIDNILTVNSTHIDWSYTVDNDLRYRDNNFVYKSYNTVDDFVYVFDIYVDYIQDSSRTIRGSFLTVTNTTEDIIYHRDNNLECCTVVLQSRNNANKFYLGLYQWENGSNTNNNTETIELYDIDRWYYLTLKREGNDYTLYVYNDTDRTVLINDLRLSVTNTYNYDKVMGICNYGYTTREPSEGYVKNLILSESGYLLTGNYYSNNLMTNTTGIDGYSFYMHGETPEGTSIETFLSRDNITWTLWDADKESVEIIDAYNYSDLYLWFRLNSTGTNTPYVNFYHLFYGLNITCNGITGPTSNNNFWLVITFIVVPCVLILGVAFRRK